MIWCLFSIENEYNQPMNNLVAWWQRKPSARRLAEMLDCRLELAIELWNGERVVLNSVQYRLEEVGEGKEIK
jgi:hypothetical protein